MLKGAYFWWKHFWPLNLFRKSPLPVGFKRDPKALLRSGCGKIGSLAVLVWGPELKRGGSSIHPLGQGLSPVSGHWLRPWRMGRGEGALASPRQSHAPSFLVLQLWTSTSSSLAPHVSLCLCPCCFFFCLVLFSFGVVSFLPPFMPSSLAPCFS